MATKDSVLYISVIVLFVLTTVLSRNDPKNDPRNSGDLALWIDEKQVKMFSGKTCTNKSYRAVSVLFLQVCLWKFMQL